MCGIGCGISDGESNNVNLPRMERNTMELTESRVDCPYCGAPITLLLDAGDAGIDYVEDCQVCCRPMIVSLHADSDGDLLVSLRREDD